LKNLDSACVFTWGVACDTIECCPPNKNDWLTVNVLKTLPVLIAVVEFL